MALARAVGVKAFFVLVERDFQGTVAPHACAAVFVADKVLLVDPTYRWFGVSHQKFEILDDLQATALHLSQLGGDIPRKRIAVKLLPKFALANFNLAFALMEAGRMKEAGSSLEAGLQVEPESWMAHYAQGMMEGFQNRWEQAANYLQKSLAVNPDWDKAYFFLAIALRNQGKLKESREQYRAYLRHQFQSDDSTEEARHAIAEINEELGEE